MECAKYLNKNILVNLYNTFILQFLIYCMDICLNSFDTHLEPLMKLH